MWLAIFEISTLSSFGRCSIWGTFLSWNTSLFSEDTIKNGPATFTSFGEVVTVHDELDREVRLTDLLMGVLHLHPALNCLDETINVARSTRTLVS